MAHELRDPVVDGINGLLHGLHSKPQSPVLLLKHGILPKQVTIALSTIFPNHPLALGWRQAGSSQELNSWEGYSDNPLPPVLSLSQGRVAFLVSPFLQVS